ncbi:MAG: prenyltransferase/squalene oxidase repeat-containing protein [Candidatus Thorarchaeota archaeon]|jgi:prenyltransferase beta subunit
MKKVKVVAIALAFTLVLVASTTQPVAAASRYDTLTSYMADRYDIVRGGYNLPFDGVTRVSPTYAALSILSEVGSLAQRPPPISITKAMEFSETHQSDNPAEEESYGGFMEYLLGPVSNDVNYNGLLLWEILKDPSFNDIPDVGDYDINGTSNAVWINTTLSIDGGYGNVQGSDAELISTFRALASFRILDEIYPLENVWNTYVNETGVLEWIDSCRDGNSYQLSPDSSRTSVSATAAAILAYEIIDPVSTVPGIANVQTWLLNRQVLDHSESEVVGGFEEGNSTDDPNIVSSYFAFTALDSLNALTNINETAAQSFILNCQAADGSWGNFPGFEEGSLLYASYAVQMLNMEPLGNALSILSSSVDPSTQGISAFDWRVIVILGIVVIAAVLALYTLRMD